MPSTYTSNPAGRAVDRVRLRLGDTAAPFILTDEEIEWFLSEANADDTGAAALGAAAMAARFAGLVDASTGDESRSHSQKAKGYAELAKRLAADAEAKGSEAAVPTPWAGGISYSERESAQADPDLIPAYFYEGMDDVPAGDPRRGVW